MREENTFTVTAKTWPAHKLLHMMDHPGEYQPLAVEAARMELESRGLTKEELDAANLVLLEKERAEIAKQQKREAWKQVTIEAGSSVLDSPETETGSPPFAIKLVSLCVAFLPAYALLKKFDELIFLLNHSSEWDISSLIYFLSIPVLATGAVLLWQHKKAGWLIVSIDIAYDLTCSLSIVILESTYTPGIESIDRFLPKTLLIYLLSSALAALILWALCKPRVRHSCKVTRTEMIFSLCAGAALMPIINLLVDGTLLGA